MPRYLITVEEVQDRGRFFVEKAGTNVVEEPTYHSMERKQFLCDPATNAKFATLLTAIDSAITTAETP